MDGLKEYPYTDYLLQMKEKAIEKAKMVGDYIATHKETVELVIKIIIVVAGVAIAIKDAVTDAKITKEKNGHSHVRWYCFLIDIINVVKRAMAA